jgi:hypothetical protein
VRSLAIFHDFFLALHQNVQWPEWGNPPIRASLAGE